MFRLKKSEMETKYDPKKVEEGKYEYWLKEGFFTNQLFSLQVFVLILFLFNV